MIKLRGVKYHLLLGKISSIYRFFIISLIFNLIDKILRLTLWDNFLLNAKTGLSKTRL